jgi:putative transposase
VDSPLGNPPQLRQAVIDVVRRLKRQLLVIGGLLARNRPTNYKLPAALIFSPSWLFGGGNFFVSRTMLNCCVRHSGPLNRLHPFTIDAFVLLPGDHNYSMRWNAIRNYFTRRCPDALKLPPSASQRRKRAQTI